MELVVHAQYYRCKTADRQLEIDECLRRNLNHPGIRKLVLFKESDAPPLPEATVELEVVESNTRITYAEWFRWVQRQGSGIALLLNADIYLDEGLEHLAATFDSPDAFLALTRYNPGHAGFHLNDYPHWTQAVWGVRADAELPESLLYASSFPLGYPGCDNRIAYVMWSHGFRVRNPCYHVRSVHLQASTARSYDKTGVRLYGGVSYVHPSLAPDEDAELEFTLWTRSQQRPAGVLVNQQAIEQGDAPVVPPESGLRPAPSDSSAVHGAQDRATFSLLPSFRRLNIRPPYMPITSRGEPVKNEQGNDNSGATRKQFKKTNNRENHYTNVA
jgi:hypothetical protein